LPIAVDRHATIHAWAFARPVDVDPGIRERKRVGSDDRKEKQKGAHGSNVTHKPS
jgi:hypothetical protein